MPKSVNQKMKLLYLMRYLLQESDEAHPVSVQQMIDELASHNIRAERKSLYDDIEALRFFGLDIVQIRSRTTGYYVGEREFEVPELKLLVDCVQSSKFITEKKTVSLIKKLEGLASVYEAQQLQRQVYVQNRVKSMNESVYYNIDEISNAIARNKVIRFRYFNYTVTKEREFRRNGAWYEISPLGLMWNSEKYYMLGFDADAGKIKHYRVDRMVEISALDRGRDGVELFESIDLSQYSKKVFSMFSGEEREVQLRFADSFVGAVIDRFGRDVRIVSTGDGYFTVSTVVEVSPRFFAWLFGFGEEAEILSPESVREEYRQALCAAAEKHGRA